MIRRIGLIILIFLLLLTPCFVSAQNGISISESRCHSESFTSCRSEHSEEFGDPWLASLLCAEIRFGVANKQAESDISILDSDVEMHFPSELVFNLEVESHADIVDARLHYWVDKMNYAQVTSEGWAEFTPATRVETSWIWDMRRMSLPPGAEVTYWWTIEDAAGNKIETSPGVIHFDDNRYHWRSLTSSGSPEKSAIFQSEGGELTLFWYEGDDSFARELMSVCEAGLARLTANIGTYPEKPIKIYVYASAGDLQGAMIFPQEWTGGVAFTEFGIIAIGISPGNLNWGMKALVHELTHLVVHQATFGPYGRLPIWLDEGLAMYNEGELDPYLQAWLKKAVSENKLISVRSLCSPFSAEPEKAYLSYAESYSLVEYLLDNYGQDKMLNLLTLFKQGNAYDEALTKVYDFDVEDLDARWQEALTTPVAQAQRIWHPALIAVLSALATSLALFGALALEEWAWQSSCRKG